MENPTVTAALRVGADLQVEVTPGRGGQDSEVFVFGGAPEDESEFAEWAQRQAREALLLVAAGQAPAGESVASLVGEAL
jgi:hypothetical protein